MQSHEQELTFTTETKHNTYQGSNEKQLAGKTEPRRSFLISVWQYLCYLKLFLRLLNRTLTKYGLPPAAIEFSTLCNFSVEVPADHQTYTIHCPSSDEPPCF